MNEATQEPLPAATVVLLRDASEGLQTFMLQRHRKNSVLGGVHVFPGGKLDAADLDSKIRARIKGSNELTSLTQNFGCATDDELEGFIVAAIRETFEEAGVLLCKKSSNLCLDSFRKELQDGKAFSQIISDAVFEIEAKQLLPLARWITPRAETRRFDARFFITLAPTDQEASFDGQETVTGEWMSAKRALKRMQHTEIQLAPPTLITLDWLCRFDSAKAALDATRQRPAPLVAPEIIPSDQGWHLSLPGDPDHAVQESAFPGPTRLILDSQGRWQASEI